MKRAEKTVLPAGKTNGGGSKPVARAARGARSYTRPGPGSDKQCSKEQRARKIEAWCQGKAERYS